MGLAGTVMTNKQQWAIVGLGAFVITGNPLAIAIALLAAWGFE